MKQKILVSGLCLTLALSLVSCGGQQTQEPQEPKQEVQQTEPVTTEPTAEPMEVKQEVKATSTQSAPVEGEQDTGNEVDPAGTAGEAEPVVELFTEVNETVYATDTVNIRSSWSAESEKLGSLNKGDSVARTGISIEGTEAEGWSRIQLSDGRIVYVSNKYLSATKPTTQSSGGGSTTQTKPQGQQGQQGQTQQPTGSQQPTGGQTSQNKDGWDQSFYDTLTPEQKAVYEGLSASSRNQMKNNILNQREREANGWTVDHGDPTEEDLKNAWSNIQMG